MPKRVYEVYWEPTFERSLARMHLTLEIFERLAKFGVNLLLESEPYEAKSTYEMPGTGHRYLATKHAFGDLPAMLIAYEVSPTSRTVTVKGAEPVWDEDLVPEL
jgi:hypothetical protein